MSHAPQELLTDSSFQWQSYHPPFPALGRAGDSLRGQGLLQPEVQHCLSRSEPRQRKQVIPSSIIYSGQLSPHSRGGGAWGTHPQIALWVAWEFWPPRSVLQLRVLERLCSVPSLACVPWGRPAGLSWEEERTGSLCTGEGVCSLRQRLLTLKLYVD